MLIFDWQGSTGKQLSEVLLSRHLHQRVLLLVPGSDHRESSNSRCLPHWSDGGFSCDLLTEPNSNAAWTVSLPIFKILESRSIDLFAQSHRNYKWCFLFGMLHWKGSCGSLLDTGNKWTGRPKRNLLSLFSSLQLFVCKGSEMERGSYLKEITSQSISVSESQRMRSKTSSLLDY